MKKDNEQSKTPFLDALVDYCQSDPTCFDVPGHKLGHFVTDLSRKISPAILAYDANAPLGLDNLYHPTSVIKESENLAAKAFHADHCLFSINGTSGGILSMFLACLDNKDKIILPRNSHKSVINALIISGAIPIFVYPEIDDEYGIANNVSFEDYKKAIDDNLDAKAIFVINPTYFGMTTDLKSLVSYAHSHNMIVIVDEAHGSNFYFSRKLPISAMDAEADITSVSVHKNSGSLTQSSLILVKGKRVDLFEVKRAYAMLSSTSPNPLLLASLDAARKEMYFSGAKLIEEDIKIAEFVKKEINKIPGLKAVTYDYKDNHIGVYDIDRTKIVINVRNLDLYGYDVYKELRKYNNIQLELGEVYSVLALIAPGNTIEDGKKLVTAFKELANRHPLTKKRHRYHNSNIFPKTIVPPREGYDAPSLLVSFKDAIGEISSETIMAYPPGIPLLIPGELITLDVIKKINFFYREGGQILKDSKDNMIKIVDKKRWYLSDAYMHSLT